MKVSPNKAETQGSDALLFEICIVITVYPPSSSTGDSYKGYSKQLCEIHGQIHQQNQVFQLSASLMAGTEGWITSGEENHTGHGCSKVFQKVLLVVLFLITGRSEPGTDGGAKCTGSSKAFESLSVLVLQKLPLGALYLYVKEHSPLKTGVQDYWCRPQGTVCSVERRSS